MVRRIFQMSANGMSLKNIAKALNAEKVSPPRPRATTVHATWCPTAIREMLRRELYIGHVVWNRSRFVKVPGTKRRVGRPRPKNEWRIQGRPELRIVSDELWRAVQARQARLKEQYGGAATWIVQSGGVERKSAYWVSQVWAVRGESRDSDRAQKASCDVRLSAAFLSWGMCERSASPPTMSGGAPAVRLAGGPVEAWSHRLHARRVFTSGGSGTN